MRLTKFYSHPLSLTRSRTRSLALLYRLLAAFAIVGLVLCGQLWRASRAASDAQPGSKTGLPAMRGQEAISHLKEQGFYSSLQEAMQAARYAPQWVANTGVEGMGGAYEMKNPANHLRAYVTGSEVRVLPMSDEAQQSWQLGLKLTSYGHGANLSAVAAGEVTARGNRVEIKRDSGLTEWYENSARGLEQGFTIDARAELRNEKAPLRLGLELSGSLKAQIDERGQQVGFSDEQTVLVYEKLAAWDAKGQELEARMELGEGRVWLVVEDEGAEYPLTIDPLLREQIRLTASDGEAFDNFGGSVAISGDTAVVGAIFGTNTRQGSAYVFVRSGATWSQQAQLTASDGAGNDEFGFSVAISGDMAVVGAVRDDVGANTDQGSAYVFLRSGTSWSQQAKLMATDGEAFDNFGDSVAISGDTAVVGAAGDDVSANVNQGSAYVFVRSGVTWAQQAQLTASDGAVDDLFGNSVAISGGTAVVGARVDDVGANTDQGSAYVFVRSGATWSQQAKLTASEGAEFEQFGWSIAISGDTAVVGAFLDDVGANPDQGSAYVFLRSGTSWSQQAKLMATDGEAFDNFGDSVAISGDTAVVGANADDRSANLEQGSAYVFVRSGVTWAQQAQLTASDGAANDNFGWSVAISGDTAIVGAIGDDVGANAEQGSAYVFICNWDQQQQLAASDGEAFDSFGDSVAISGDTAVVGADFDNVGANLAQGSAYVFVRSGVTWSQQAKLTASDGAANDNFGISVAIIGDTAVVGAYADDVGANVNQGSAYVFVRSGVTWTQQAQLTASDGAAGDFFSVSVAISGDTAVVGANGDDVGANTNQGSAYVFMRNGVTWTQQAQLTASDGAASDRFGASVAISGDTAVVGAVLDDVGVNANQGSAYVFVRNGVTWTQQAQLTASDGAANDNFGISVAISGDTAVVGAFLDDVGANPDQGSAYVFVRSGVTWSQQAQLTASDGAGGDNFGVSIAISGDTAIIGANNDDVGANTDQGSAYVFVRSGVGWTERQRLTAPDGATGDFFGWSVAISGDTAIVGAVLDAVGANTGQGSAYVFFTACNTSPTLAASNQVRQKGSPAALSTIATVDDGQDPIGFLSVSVVSAPAGISITNIANSNGVITAQVAALCNAALGNNTVLLRVEDSDGATGQVTLYVNVTANTVPTLGSYADTSIVVTNSVNVTPSAPPSDNGSIVKITADSPTFAGGLSINPDDGTVMIDNARPGGAHVVTITAIDNCGASRSRAFILTVSCQSITVNPSTIPAGTAGSAYSQTFTQTGGNGTVTFALTGTLPAGLSFTAGTATLSGTSTQVGSFPITVTATDQNNCSGSRSYTLVINAPLLVWNGATSTDWHNAANWTPNQVPTTFHDVSIPSTGVVNQPVISAASSSINAMTLQAGRVLTINSSRQLATASNITNNGQINGAGSLLFDGATFTQNGSVSLASVEFDVGAHALAGGGSFASGIITVLGGASVSLASNHSVSVIVINGGGSFDITNRSLTLTGAGTAIFNSGSVNATGSTIIYQGTVAQVVTANINYNNLTVNNSAGVSLAGDTTVSGQLNLQTDLTAGAFTLTMPGSGTSTGSGDVFGKVKRTGFVSAGAALSFGNPLNRIRIDSGAAPTDVTVDLVNLPPFGYSNTVTRTYSITANGGDGYSATMRLRYKDADASGLDETTFELWRQDGASWVSPAGATTRDTTQNWVEESGITQFSPWTIAGGGGPICGVLMPRSQLFEVRGAEGSVVVTALANCSWSATPNVSWIEVTTNQIGAGTEAVSYVVRDNLSPMPRLGTITISGQTFTVVQEGLSGPECTFDITPKFTTFSAGGGAGSVSLTTGEQCAWEAVSDSNWIVITSLNCGIDDGTITFTVAANPGPSGRSGRITIGGKVFAIKQGAP